MFTLQSLSLSKKVHTFLIGNSCRNISWKVLKSSMQGNSGILKYIQITGYKWKFGKIIGIYSILPYPLKILINWKTNACHHGFSIQFLWIFGIFVIISNDIFQSWEGIMRCLLKWRRNTSMKNRENWQDLLSVNFYFIFSRNLKKNWSGKRKENSR